MDQRLRNFEGRSQQFWSSVLSGHLDLPTTRAVRVILSVVSVCVYCLSGCLFVNTVTREPLQMSSIKFSGIRPMVEIGEQILKWLYRGENTTLIYSTFMLG